MFYSQEAKGSCVLCGDTLHMVPTPMETTRIYSRVDAPAPPTPLDQRVRHYTTDSLPLPPPPKPLAPRASPPPPAPLVHLGWNAEQGDGTHFECTFVPHIEFSVDSPLGYTNTHASTRFECCNQCGLATGCQDFVYQHSTGLCVLLPHASSAKDLLRLPNPNVISGSLAITAVRQELSKHGKCDFKPASSYTGGALGAAQVPQGGKPIATRQDCCDACLASPTCGKLAFQPESHECLLFEAYAEAYSTDGLISGVLTDRYESATGGLGMAGAHSGGGKGGGGGGGGGVGGGGARLGNGNGAGLGDEASYGLEAPPLPPALTGQAAPPPVPPPGASEMTKHVVSALSMFLFAAMIGGFVVCITCFFSQDIKRVVFGLVPRASGYVRANTSLAPAEEDAEAELAAAGSGGAPDGRKRRGREDGRTGRGTAGGRAVAGEEEPSVAVTVVTAAVTQTKHPPLADCLACDGSLPQLLATLMELFPAVLRDRRRETILLQCRVDGGGGGGGGGGVGGGGGGKKQAHDEASWLLVTADSDLDQVLACPALRLIEKPKPFKEEAFSRAFVGDAPPRSGDGGDKSRRSRANGGGRRGGRHKQRGDGERGPLPRGDGEGDDDDGDGGDGDVDDYEQRAAAAARAARVAQAAAEAAEAEAASRRRAKAKQHAVQVAKDTDEETLRNDQDDRAEDTSTAMAASLD